MESERIERIAKLANMMADETEEIIGYGFDDQSGQATPEEHQEWLDGASDEEIASWVVGYTR